MAKEVEPLISVIVPTYNVEEYITEAIVSIFNQTYNNLEIIVVDDASTDNTYAILQSLQSKDPRLKLFRNDTNLKISKTLNRALKYASGDYIARMDGDDISYPERIEKQLSYIKSMNVDIVGVSNEFFNSQGVFAVNNLGADSVQIVNEAKFRNPMSHNWLARRKVYDFLCGYNDCPPVEDYDFVCRAILNDFKLVNLSYVGMKIRFRQGNTFDQGAYLQYCLAKYLSKEFRKSLLRGDKSISYNRLKKVEPSHLVQGMYRESLRYRRKYMKYRNDRNYFGMVVSSVFAMFLHPNSVIDGLLLRFVTNKKGDFI
ncbi:glycosyltransferase family 2 protein [Vibrio sp. JPW-9-11-11]|uniref:glycosyltransferase family 2 protein n=1 Tax=Vibrio sp. JPW-9-11-11 TaxID=1416532 RepID=UPI0015948FEB|nr:glycosyltransferase family 2 protein [Vibrio sp. JPW-9-11-11]NVD05389.1 glycosyltransferase family 2 protein [Vibrio sp. JPW-9-11-11]